MGDCSTYFSIAHFFPHCKDFPENSGDRRETSHFDIGQYFAFKLPYFQDNLYMMIVMGAIYGVLRLIISHAAILYFFINLATLQIPVCETDYSTQ